MGLALHAFASTGALASEIRDRTGRDVAVLQAWIGASVGVTDDEQAVTLSYLKIDSSDVRSRCAALEGALSAREKR